MVIEARGSRSWQHKFAAIETMSQDPLPAGAYQAATYLDTMDGPWFGPAVIVEIK